MGASVTKRGARSGKRLIDRIRSGRNFWGYYLSYAKSMTPESVLVASARQEDWKRSRPWYSSLMGAKARCENPNATGYRYYGGRGILFKLSEEDIRALWFRDKAYLLDCPTIDRIDPDGDYVFANCQWLSRSDNSIKSWQDRRSWSKRSPSPRRAVAIHE